MKSVINFLKELNCKVNISEERIIISAPNESIAYYILDYKVRTVAKYFRVLGIGSKDLVAILCDNSPDYIISILALWILEAIPIPLNTRLSASEIEEQINFLGCKFILTDYLFKEKVSKIKIEKINIHLIYFNLRGDDVEFRFNQNGTALIMFTSGSSGKPKAVELTFSNLIQSAKIGNNYLMQTSKDRWLASLPFYHIGGFSIIFRALMFGTEIILPNNLKMQSIIQSINHFKPTLISFVSSQMKELLKNNIQPHDELKHVLLGGGFIDSNLMREALQKGWNVSKVYGSTETSSFVTVLSPEEFKLKPESAGKSIPPNEVYIVDGNGNELPIEIEGEIAIKSPAVMQRYFNEDAATKNKLVNGIYLTGDIGYKDSEGYLYLVNRRSDLIVTGGENVNPAEVEEIIMKFPKVKDVCVFGIDDIKWGQKVTASIVSTSSQKFSLNDLRNFLKDKLASFKIPKEIYFVDELPKTELGKVRREAVKKMFSKEESR
jgi:O-succinylbenzoic acid--CoA ligase